MLSHKSSVEPQDLPQLRAAGKRVRVDYIPNRHLIAAVAHRIEIEE